MSRSQQDVPAVEETGCGRLSVVRDADGKSSPRGKQDEITAAVAQISKSRSTIDQAKGMLMCIYGIDAEEAFGLLRWQSQHHNVKLRTVAEQLIHDFQGASAQQQTSTRRTYDELLVTVHTRTGTPILTDAAENMTKRMTPTDQ